MKTEIERKFLVRGNGWRGIAPGAAYVQGYIADGEHCAVRVRIADEETVLCVKAARPGLAREEYEYSIPPAEARCLLERFARRPLIEKTRYRIPYHGFSWEIDEFAGANQGLVLAEIELESEEQLFDAPPWLGEEVSADPRYYNAALARRPYGEWRRSAKNKTPRRRPKPAVRKKTRRPCRHSAHGVSSGARQR